MSVEAHIAVGLVLVKYGFSFGIAYKEAGGGLGVVSLVGNPIHRRMGGENDATVLMPPPSSGVAC